MGTADLACASLDALLQAPSIEVVAVVTQPDKPRGRDLRLQPPAVKQLALSHNRPVLQPTRAREESFLAQLQSLRPELIVVAAYGQILPQAILDLPGLGCLNVHTSLLPKYRGAAPIQWAILDGETETGVTIMKMDAGLDTGDILAREKISIGPDETSAALHDRLAQLGAKLLLATIPRWAAGEITPEKQPNTGVSYARKVTREDARLDWSQPARALHNRIRAFTPWPGAFTFQQAEGKPRLLKICQAAVAPDFSGPPGKILEAGKDGIIVACGTGALRILRLQREGGRPLNSHEFLTGTRLHPSEQLG